jgi:hypothetical protein
MLAGCGSRPLWGGWRVAYTTTRRALYARVLAVAFDRGGGGKQTNVGFEQARRAVSHGTKVTSWQTCNEPIRFDVIYYLIFSKRFPQLHHDCGKLVARPTSCSFLA